jgi:alkyl hydroperoxide reductase subunit AhpC
MISSIVAILLLAVPPTPAVAKPRTNLLAVASVGDAAPLFGLPVLNIDTFGQKRFGMERYVGKKADDPRRAVILSFSASYCEPCRSELAALKTLEAELAAANVSLAVVIVDHEEEGKEQIRKMAVEDLQLRYPVLWDEARFVARRYGAETLPFVALVDGSGVLRWVHAGYSEKMLDALKAELKKLGIGINEPRETKTQKKKDAKKGRVDK